MVVLVEHLRPVEVSLCDFLGKCLDFELAEALVVVFINCA